MSRELTREEKAAIRALVVKWCANYDREYGCLPLDCECYMLGKCWTGGGATAPRLAPALRSGNRSGIICGKSGAGEWKIRPPETRLYQGFAGAVQGRGVSFHVLPLFSADTFHISGFERRLSWKKIKAM